MRNLENGQIDEVEEVEEEEIDWNEDWTDDEERIFAAFLARRAKSVAS